MNGARCASYLGEQLRLSFADPVDRMIGAHLIALLCPAGRLTADPAAIAGAMAIPLERVEAVRARMMRFDPVGLFARDLKECLAAQLAERDRLDPAMAALLDNLDLLARRELRRLASICGVDADDLAEMIAEIRSLDPKPAASYDTAPAQVVIPDILMRPNGDGYLADRDQSGHHAAPAGERALLRAGRAARAQGGSAVPRRAACERQLAGAFAAAAGADHPEGGGGDHPPAGRFHAPRRRASASADPARHRRGGGDAREHGQPRDGEQVHRDAARHVRA